MLFISSKIESSQLVRSSPSRRLGLVVGKTGMDEDDDTLLFWRNSTNCSIFLFSFQTDLSLLDEMDEDAHTALNTYINWRLWILKYILVILYHHHQYLSLLWLPTKKSGGLIDGCFTWNCFTFAVDHSFWQVWHLSLSPIILLLTLTMAMSQMKVQTPSNIHKLYLVYIWNKEEQWFGHH